MSATLHSGDCLEVLMQYPGAARLVMTSPPYADQRASTYGGVKPDDYCEWFLPRAAAIKAALADDGSFVLNIKERVVDGERHTYVHELIAGMRAQGWRWVEEYIWHKKNSAPGKWPNRFRDSWERVLHFTKAKHFYMDQDAVRVPVGDWSKSRLANLSDTDRKRDESGVSSGFGKKVSNWIGRDTVYPSNVLHLATECGNKQHSAAFPEALPEWFVRLLSAPGDLVIDPFAGSGTTGVVCARLGRRFVGVDMVSQYVETARARIAKATTPTPGEAK